MGSSTLLAGTMEDEPASPVARSFEATHSTREAAGKIINFHDDASLPIASSTIRFRATKTTTRVYPNGNGTQFIIEDDCDDDGNREVTAKIIETKTISLSALRATYTLVCLFFVGFLFVFSLELLLYVVLDLTIEIGATSKGEIHIGTALGILFALPLYVHGLACALVIADAFVQDAWSGHTLVKRFIFDRYGDILTEWICFTVFLGLPVFVGIVTLFSGMENWWELTSLTWFVSIGISYLVFAGAVVYFENRACWAVTRNRYDDDDDSWPEVIRRAVLLRQRHLFGGIQHTTYLALGAIDDGLGADSDEHVIEETHRLVPSFYTKMISWLRLTKESGGIGLFETLETPERQFSLSDAKGERPFVTADTWGLESIFCRPRDSRFVAVVRGKQALTPEQMRASAVCAILGYVLIILLIASLLWWMDLPTFAVFAAVVLVVVFGIYPGVKSSYRMFVMTRDLAFETSVLYIDDEEESAETGEAKYPEGAVEEPDIVVEKEENEPVANLPTSPAIPQTGAETVLPTDLMGRIMFFKAEVREKIIKSWETGKTKRKKAFELSGNESEGIYQVWETQRVITPSERLCWIFFSTEIIFLFVWPVVALCLAGSIASATIFFFIAVFSSLRSYFNAAIVLEETGTLKLVDGQPGSREYWQNQSQLSTITTKITRSRARNFWVGILCVLLVAFLGLFGLAVTQEGDTTSDFQFTYLPDFEYTQKDDLTYPTCSFGKGLAELGSPTTDMSDYAFLAALAYRDPSITQSELDSWFGNGTATDNQDFVDNYRNATDGFESAVSYKMITFPESNLAMVAIRGTTNAWDALTDAQLWAAAAVFQALRFVLPIGDIWTPILHRCVNVLSWLASSTISRVAFYKETTAFVEQLKDDETFQNIQVTGHSLGGGLSIITGAQTGVAAVALSGPNAMLSRESFEPPITEDALNTLTFNIIPERDIVPRLDDKAKLNQAIRCTAPYNDFVGCHDGRRSLCEIIYTCGTKSRPALCDCTTEFGYPEPIRKEGTTGASFAELCGSLIG